MVPAIRAEYENTSRTKLSKPNRDLINRLVKTETATTKKSGKLAWMTFFPLFKCDSCRADSS